MIRTSMRSDSQARIRTAGTPWQAMERLWQTGELVIWLPQEPCRCQRWEEGRCPIRGTVAAIGAAHRPEEWTDCEWRMARLRQEDRLPLISRFPRPYVRCTRCGRRVSADQEAITWAPEPLALAWSGDETPVTVCARCRAVAASWL